MIKKTQNAPNSGGIEGTGPTKTAGVSKIYVGATRSNGPKSSFSSLGVDAATVVGSAMGEGGRAVSNMKTSKEMNSGASVKKSANSNFGLGSAEGAQGTVGAKENMGKTGRTGQFATSAKHGSVGYGNKSTYGPNGRPEGTPGEMKGGGSMTRARAGLRGTSPRTGT